ncbi:MICAL-like protein 1 isoform X1 [Pectinophora gossypiella]|uniref:MICAL-like protein 1 isoform X1 n=1 Tax=Pectinophora gossypiella TaxID=13191 RepID=UPI00214F5244|nr:MICAL-like protein 1 isoform X1 [Pectinophora gossypiella]
MSERKGTKALELWCKRLVKDCPEVQIDNMTTSWRNGVAFCALVHHFRPDLIDMAKLKPENIYENNQLAFSIAEKHLGIPSLLDPEDMVENEVPDRLSILTYLSQFYQRLGHTVNTKSTESESKLQSPSSTQSTAPIKFGKAGLDKCAACGLPVYLAQRLIVSHKLYHRRCFRCSKCSGHLNPKNFEVIEGSDFSCDSCKNEKTLSKFLNNNDQMGMLAFSDDLSEQKPDDPIEEPISPKHRARPQSILEKISMFENNVEKDTSIDNKLGSLSLKDTSSKHKEISTSSNFSSTSGAQGDPFENIITETDSKSPYEKEILNNDSENILKKSPEKVYKSNINKFNFLQTQLSGDVIELDSNMDDSDVVTPENKTEDCCIDKDEETSDINKSDIDNDIKNNVLKEEKNITDDIRLAKTHNVSDADCPSLEESDINQADVIITVPPRRKKLLNSPEKRSENNVKKDIEQKKEDVVYPDHLNPFSDDEDEDDKPQQQAPKKVSTNPFGSSDEEDDEVPPIQRAPAVPAGRSTTPVKRLIAANPFWSDDEEPSSDEETHNESSKMYDSSLATSTPNLPSSTPRRKKGRAPPPPSIRVIEPNMAPATSMDDVASLSSLSSYNSTIHSDQKSVGKITPRLKKRLAPTPPDSLSTVSGGAGSLEKGVDSIGRHNSSNTSDGTLRKAKGPAPGLPLPERREVKMQISPEELQVQLDLLETQQLGLERQGVLIETMIRDKCEGDEASSVPQEEVEDLVIQLCELVNEKNDLFRKQTELMYIRRQQRLEQEQADIEHEIRVIQSRPAVNRIDADKAREEQLVARLVQIVRMRDELVQQIDAERRRERQEDLAIAASIASKRAQRNSDSNSSSMKSGEVAATPKKNKVKDKMKKQFKKAKHSLISKKKDDSGDNKKEDKPEKEKKSK